MTSIDHYFASRQCLWGEFSSSAKDFLTVSEVWHSTGSNTNGCKSSHRTINNEELSTWLDDTNKSQPVNTTLNDRKYVLRVAWIPYDRKQGLIDVGTGVLEVLTRAFHHQLVQTRFRATFAGFASLTEPSNGSRAYYFCKHPHLALTWSQCTITGLTSVICIAEQKKIIVLQDLLSCEFIQALANLELIPSLMCSILCCREIDYLLNSIKQQVRQTEVRTGHHGFLTRSEPPATGDLLRLSADMSGCLSNLAVITRRLGVVGELNKFMVGGAENSPAFEEFRWNFKVIEQHSVMQRLDTEFFVQRAQIQRDALVHLIAGHDILANRDLAKDTRYLAHLSLQDSAGIKALTILATIFIPPTFVSSLFSMPLFDWSSAGTEPWVKRLLLYLYVTGPLMLLTFAIWGSLVLGRRIKNKKEIKKSRLATRWSNSQGSEVISLVSKRMSDTSISGDSEAPFGRISNRFN